MDNPAPVGNVRFFSRTGPHSLMAVAAAAGCVSPGRDILVPGLASLARAKPDEISFVASRRHAAALAQTRAGAVLVDIDLLPMVPSGTIPLITSDAMAGWDH